MLLRSRADPSSADEDGRTPVWVAAFYGNAGALAALLARRQQRRRGQDNEGEREKQEPDAAVSTFRECAFSS